MSKATNGNGEKSHTPLSAEELAACRAKWEAARLVEEAWRRLHSEYERAYGKYPYSVNPSEHDTLHFWTSVAISNMLTEHASVREIDSVTAVLKEVPSGSVFTDNSSAELEHRVKEALAAVRVKIASEPSPVQVEPAKNEAQISSETREEKARRLFAEGASVRTVAQQLGCSVGKAHQLKRGFNS